MMWLWMVMGSAWAGNDAGADMVSAAEGRQAEYVRLSEEMHKAVKRDNWVHVERMFQKLDAIGEPHTRTVLLKGAHAAQNLGNIMAVKRRLLDAQKLEESEEIRLWLWELQRNYGPVMLAADLPANYRLEVAELPFDPNYRRAVEFAQREILESSYFEGLLPRGDYVFKPYGEEDSARAAFVFTLRADRQRFDLRTRDVPTGRDRKKRARIDRRIAKQEKRSAQH